jgi:hypothetical protein
VEDLEGSLNRDRFEQKVIQELKDTNEASVQVVNTLKPTYASEVDKVALKKQV